MERLTLHALGTLYSITTMPVYTHIYYKLRLNGKFVVKPLCMQSVYTGNPMTCKFHMRDLLSISSCSTWVVAWCLQLEVFLFLFLFYFKLNRSAK